MHAYALNHVGDRELLHNLATLVAQDRTTTASMLAHIAEVDARRLYRPASYPSMYAYCLNELHLSEAAAYKRIEAARAARDFPALFPAVADGRLHLTAVLLIAAHLTPENVDALIAGAAHKSKAEIEQWLAERFPKSEMLPLVEVLPISTHVADEPMGESAESADRCVGTCATQLAPAQVATPRSTVKAHAPGRFALHLTIGQAMYDKLEYAEALLSHALPAADVAQVLEEALDALIEKREKGKFAATARPQKGQRRSTVSRRHIPAHVKLAVWQRDQGQCAFVSETGRRCAMRELLEYDHLDPVARGGEATVERMRLLCRPHNQYEAECTFGAGFMNEKREQARTAAAAKRAAAISTHASASSHAQHEAISTRSGASWYAQTVEAEAHARVAAEEHTQDVIKCLRELGCRAEEARRIAESCEHSPDATLEERVHAALKHLGPKPRFHGRVGTTIGVQT